MPREQELPVQATPKKKVTKEVETLRQRQEWWFPDLLIDYELEPVSKHLTRKMAQQVGCPGDISTPSTPELTQEVEGTGNHPGVTESNADEVNGAMPLPNPQ